MMPDIIIALCKKHGKSLAKPEFNSYYGNRICDLRGCDKPAIWVVFFEDKTLQNNV